MKRKILSTLKVLGLGVLAASLFFVGSSNVNAQYVGLNFGERTDISWEKISTYLKTSCYGGCDILINGINRYLNFGATSGDSGYGIRDNAGTVEFKNSGGAWAGIGSGTGSGSGDSHFELFNGTGIRQVTSTNQVVLGFTATTTDAQAQFPTSTSFGNVPYLWPSTAGTNGQVLRTDGSSQLTWASVGGGGTDGNWVFFNGSGIQLATTSNQVLIGDTTTSTDANLEVNGSAQIDSLTVASSTLTNFTATNSTTTNATTTNFFSTNASSTNATSTYFFTNFATTTKIYATTGQFVSATTTDLYSTVFGINSEYFTDLTGTGLQFNSGSLETTLGTSVDLTSEVTGTLPITNGGTGTSTPASYGSVLVFTGSVYEGFATSTLGINFDDILSTLDISAQSNLAVASPITLTGDSVGFDFSTNNTWTGGNIFGNTTSTNATSTNLSVSGNLNASYLSSALVLAGSDGDLAEYAGGTCTNQFVRSISATGGLTCADVALGTDTTGNYVATIADAGSSRVTVSGSGSESAAVTLDIPDIFALIAGDSFTGQVNFDAGLLSSVSSTFQGDLFVNGTTTLAGATTSISGVNYNFPDSDGTNAQVLRTNGAGQLSWASVSGGGTDGNWTFFNGSGIQLTTTTNQVLLGASATTTNDSLEVTNDVAVLGELHWWDADQSAYFGITATSTIASSILLYSPATAGTAGQFLTTNGSNELNWSNIPEIPLYYNFGTAYSGQVSALAVFSPSITNVTSTITGVTGIVETDGDTLDFNLFLTTDRSVATSSMKALFTSYQTLTSTTSLQTFTVNGSSTINSNEFILIDIINASTTDAGVGLRYKPLL